MKTLLSLIAYALVASILIAVIYAVKSARLQNRFRQLGALKGRALDEVLKVAGKPSHRTKLGANRELLEWRRVGFHIALTFTDGVCDGVVYESRT
jgi:Na+-translocating ferredoxin:NAD+ oxidoreductase RnfG subunit